MLALVGALVVGAIAANFKRQGRLNLGPVSIRRDGVFLNGKPVCGAPGPAPSPEATSVKSQPAREEEELRLVFLPTEQETVKLHNLEDKTAKQWQSFLFFRKMLLTLLFLMYVGASVGLPWLEADTASCKNGFFWETHMIFFTVFLSTKLVELLLYTNDPTILGELEFADFMLKFMPSFLGYMDGYTDATAIVIANSCEDPFAQYLGKWMGITYLVGVVFGQWVVVAILAVRDPSQACLMKVVHMDALASCVSLPEQQKWVWNALHLVRTFGEDLPQAVLQTLFLIKVKKNYFMILSICVGIASSIKALRDAYQRALVAMGAYNKLEKEDDEDKLLLDIAVFWRSMAAIRSTDLIIRQNEAARRMQKRWIEYKAKGVDEQEQEHEEE